MLLFEIYTSRVGAWVNWACSRPFKNITKDGPTNQPTETNKQTDMRVPMEVTLSI